MITLILYLEDNSSILAISILIVKKSIALNYIKQTEVNPAPLNAMS